MKLMNFEKVLKEFKGSASNTVQLMATRTQEVENVFNIIENGKIYFFCVQPIEAEPHYVLINASEEVDIPFAVKVSDVRNGKVDCENIFSNNFLLVDENERIACVLKDEMKSISNLIQRLRGIRGDIELEQKKRIDMTIKEIDKWTCVIEIEAKYVPIFAQQFPDHLLDEMDDLTSSGFVFDIDAELANYAFYHKGKK